MEQSNNIDSNKLIVLPKDKGNIVVYTEADNRLVSVLEEKLKQAKTIEEYKEIWGFLSDIKKDTLTLHFDTQQRQVALNKQKTDLVLYKANKGTTLIIGVGLFISSFFVFPVNPILGGVFFGTGLGALGIGTFSLKSLINK